MTNFIIDVHFKPHPNNNNYLGLSGTHENRLFPL